MAGNYDWTNGRIRRQPAVTRTGVATDPVDDTEVHGSVAITAVTDIFGLDLEANDATAFTVAAALGLVTVRRSVVGVRGQRLAIVEAGSTLRFEDCEVMVQDGRSPIGVVEYVGGHLQKFTGEVEEIVRSF